MEGDTLSHRVVRVWNGLVMLLRQNHLAPLRPNLTKCCDHSATRNWMSLEGPNGLLSFVSFVLMFLKVSMSSQNTVYIYYYISKISLYPNTVTIFYRFSHFQVHQLHPSYIFRKCLHFFWKTSIHCHDCSTTILHVFHN